jgi:hypothetical protein
MFKKACFTNKFVLANWKKYFWFTFFMILWHVTGFAVVDAYKILGETCFRHLQVQETTRRHIPGHCNTYYQHRVLQTSYILPLLQTLPGQNDRKSQSVLPVYGPRLKPGNARTRAVYSNYSYDNFAARFPGIMEILGKGRNSTPT